MKKLHSLKNQAKEAFLCDTLIMIGNYSKRSKCKCLLITARVITKAAKVF